MLTKTCTRFFAFAVVFWPVGLAARSCLAQAVTAPATHPSSSSEPSTQGASAQATSSPAQATSAPAPTATAAGPATSPITELRPALGLFTRPSTQPAAGLRNNITLNFKDAPLDAVLDYFSEAAGFVIVKEGPVDGRVTVLSKQPISSAEAVVVLNAALRVNGFAAIQNGRELKIMTRDQAKHGSIPVHFGANPEDVAKTDELITQVIPIRNVDATRLRADLAPLVGQVADMTANEGANAIVITDLSTNIRRIVEVVAALDQQESTSSQMKVIQLKFASASTTAKLIETIFKEGPPRAGQPQGQMIMGPNGPQPAPPQPGGGASHPHGTIVAAADDRTNTLILIGTADMLKLAEGLLKQLDANTTPASELRAFPLRYGEAEAASKLIASMFKTEDAAPNPFGFFIGRMGNMGGDEGKVKVTTAFDDRTNTVIVTAPSIAMKQIEILIQTIDVNSDSGSQIRIWTLKYADAFSASKLINSVFNPTSPGEKSSPFIPVFIFGGGPTQPQRGTKVNATSDDRTNTLIVSATPETMKIVEGIVKQLDDNPASEQTFFTYTVKNGQSQEIAATLNSLFGVPGNGQTGGRNATGTTNTFSGANAANGNRNNSNATGSGTNANNNQPINRANNNQPGGQAAVPASIANAVSSLTGQVYVVADADTNSLLVATAGKYQDRVKQIIIELDRPVPQVLIKVLIAEVTHDNSTDLGTDFSVLNTRASGNGQTIVSNLGNAGSQTINGGLAVGLLETNLTATLHLLALQNKLDVLSRPYILASDNQIATITIGQEVPIITGSQISDLGSVNNQIQYRQVGITLNVTPHINPEGLVILDVSPEVSELTTQTVPVANGVNAPIFDNRSADTRVGIRDGSTIVIGGMMQDQKMLTIKKVPLLGDIPWLGALFQRQQIDKTKTELLIFLTPHVASAPDRLKPMSEDEMKGLRLTPNAVEPGVFQEHIRGLQRGGATTEPSLIVPAPTTRPRNIAEPPLPGTH